jgi:hypothetical protein
LPILVTLFGIVIEVRFEQFINAQSPMPVTLLGIIIEVKPVTLENASMPITVTPSSIITVITSANVKVSIPLPVRHAVVPALLLTVSVPPANVHPSPLKVPASTML